VLLRIIKYLATRISGENDEHCTTTAARKHLMSQKHEKIEDKNYGYSAQAHKNNKRTKVTFNACMKIYNLSILYEARERLI
jgi:uncharacterized protein with FMN-binding domain